MIDSKYLDQEEKDLAEALKEVDINNLSKPSKEKEKTFKNAATEFRKINIKDNKKFTY